VGLQRRVGWAGHAAHIGERRGCTGFWWGNLREKDLLGDPGLNGKTLLGWIFRKWDGGRVWTESSWLSIWTGG